MKLLINLALNILALLVVAYLVPGFSFDSIQSVIVASIVIGIINTIIKPIFQILALPITIITFGIFALIINIFLLWAASWIVPGFDIVGLWTAVIGSIALSLISWFLSRLVKN